MKEAALLYAKEGLAVFPLKPRTKEPATFNGYKSATTNQEKIMRWWSENPNYNIGIATGSYSGGLVVVDLDVKEEKGEDGREVWHEWEREHGEFPESWRSITGRGGYHLIYRDAATHKCSSGLYPGVDVRADGGYIVAPPSIHTNGRTYEWEIGPGDCEIAPVNDSVVNFLMGPIPEEWDKQTFEVLEQIPEGTRVNTLVKLVCSQQAKGLSDEAIRAAVRAENEARCIPPLSEKELEKEVFPALKRYQKGTAAYQKDYSKRSNWSVQPPASNGPINLIPIEDVEEKTPEWLISDYIPRYKLTVLVGDGGSGKTTIWCAIAAAVSSGNPCFLNQDNPFAQDIEPGKVLFFSSEDSAEYTLRARLRRAGADLKNVLYLDLTDARFAEIKFNSPALEEIIKTYKPALVIFDPIQSFIPPEVQMGQRNAMRACINPLIGLGAKYKVTFLIVVHTNKQANVWGRKRMADSSDIWDIARSVLIIGEAVGGLRYLSQEKCNDAPLASSILFRLDSGTVEFDSYTTKKDKDFVMANNAATYQAPARDLAKELILDYLKDGEKETKDLDSMMEAQGVSKRTLERAKVDLKKDGKITYFSRGYGKEKIHLVKLSLTDCETLAE